jgi:hypothetical protein
MLAFLTVLPSCGARASLEQDADAESGGGSPKGPTAIFELRRSAGRCLVGRSNTIDESAIRADSGDRNVIVRFALADEKCSGAGGTYVLAKEVDSNRVHWLGGQGCRLDEPTLTTDTDLGYGVARTSITAALFQLSQSDSFCLAFPGEPYRSFSSNEPLLLVASFASLEAAQAYAQSLKQ